ncbi:MAG TPA: restriction endonuclease subunit S [Anaerolineales bacterium]
MSDSGNNEWVKELLGQLVELRRGITYNLAILDSEKEGLPYINMKSFLKGGGFNHEGTKRYAGIYGQQDLIGEFDLLIANTDVTAGDIVGVPAVLPDELVSQKALYSHHVTRLRIIGGIIVPFLYYLLCLPEYRSQMLRIARGTTVLMLDMQAIKRIPIRMPKEIAEQRRITKLLTTIDTAIKKTESLIAKYQQIKAGLMYDLFTRGVTANGKLRPPRDKAPELYKETPIGWIPKEWVPRSLRNLVGAENVINGPFGSDLLTSELKTEGILVLYVQDIKPGYFNRISNAYVTQYKAAELAFCNVRADDVLVAKVGAPPCDSCVYDLEVNAIVTQDVIRIRPKFNIDSIYLSSIINSAFGRKSIKKISIRGTRERVSLTEFKSLVFPIAALQEQVDIGKLLAGAQDLIEKETSKREKLLRLKLGLMHDLLTGKVPLKVEQEPVEMVCG